MDYAAHYDRLISRARDRTLEGYREHHHVVPRCLGGNDSQENIVELTAEEHYVAHQLLVRVHDGHSGLVYACLRMAKQCAGNKAYGWLRRRYAASLRGNKGRHSMPHTPESRAKMSNARKGSTFPNRKRGIVFTDEHRANLSAARAGKKRSSETIAKVAAGNRGKVRSDETRAKLSAARRKRVTTPETRAKMSATRTGVKLGPRSPETRAKLSAALKQAWASGKARNQWNSAPPP